ncbi:MAG: hypothetical protein SYC29_08155 [Planctomycetota bacterium]|nr:hypothetical protein [Planctomycetota bacterium]
MNIPKKAYCMRSVSAILLLSASAAAACPDYAVEAFLPADVCTGIDLSADESLVYARHNFGEWDQGALIFDATTYELLGEVCHLDDVPWVFLCAADDGSLWCQSYYGGLVREVSSEDCSVLNEFDVGDWAAALLFDDAKRHLYVNENHPGGAHNVQGSIQVIDTWTNQHVGGLTLNGQFSLMNRAPRDRYLYTVTSNPGTETLYKIDTADPHNLSIAGTLDLSDLGGGEPFAVGISISPDFGTVYVPSPFTDEILVVDTETMTDVGRLSAGAPHGFFVAPDGKHALVMHRNLPIVSVFDLEEENICDTIDVGAYSYADANVRPVWTADACTVYLPLKRTGDGVVVLKNWCRAADVNADDVIDTLDLLALLGHWGACP